MHDYAASYQGIIRKVKLSKEQMEHYRKVVETKKFPISNLKKKHLIQELVGGLCCISMEISYPLIDENGGEIRKASLVERY